MKKLLLILVIFSACSNETKNNAAAVNKGAVQNESKVDKENGFQDIKLGSYISNYRQRITYQDSITTSKDAMMYVITINKIAPLCLNDEKARVLTYKGKIMLISMLIYCPDIFEMFKNKYGEPTQNLSDACEWDGLNVALEISKNEGHIKGHEIYNISYVEKNIQKEYDGSKQGNL